MLKNVVNNNKTIFFNIFETEKGAMYISIYYSHNIPPP